MTYERIARSALEYDSCRYGTSKTLFRGPKKSLETDFVAVLGGSECYGRYVETPFSERLEARLGIPCVNFGQMNGGLDVFVNDAAILDLANQAKVTVVQALPAHNLSNRFYTVHPRRNDRFLKPSALMQNLFQSVDFSEFHFTRHMLLSLRSFAPDKFRMIVQEVQAAWTARMRLLLSRIDGPKVLLWLPDATQRATDSALGAEPLFVTEAMVRNLEPMIDRLVTYDPSARREEVGIKGMLVPDLETPIAHELLPPACHEDIAEALHDCIAEMAL